MRNKTAYVTDQYIKKQTNVKILIRKKVISDPNRGTIRGHPVPGREIPGFPVISAVGNPGILLFNGVMIITEDDSDCLGCDKISVLLFLF